MNILKSNKQLGGDYEQTVCQALAAEGYWVHNFANRQNGQPMDIIAVKDNRAVLIDAKVCSDGRFRTSRIEENQVLSMKKWFSCGNTTAMLWISMPDGMQYLLPIMDADHLDRILQKSVLTADDLRQMGYVIERKERAESCEFWKAVK